MRSDIEHFINRCWYPVTKSDHIISQVWQFLFLPFSWLFAFMVKQRIKQSQISTPSLKPVIVIGNLNVGGTGKTPLIIAIAKSLQERGFKPGIVSRGYHSKNVNYPYLVKATDDVLKTGDEPLLIAQTLNCPIVIDPNRLNAALHIQKHCDIDIILSDDGLQHYQLPRNMNIVVVDESRLFGNQKLIPAGPLREPLARLKDMDWQMINTTNNATNKTSALISSRKVLYFQLKAAALKRMVDNYSIPITDNTLAENKYFQANSKVYASAGIGNPHRFYNSLRQLGLTFKTFPLGDHQPLKASTFPGDKIPIAITSKDSVKCRALFDAPFIDNNFLQRLWVLEVDIDYDNEQWHVFIDECIALI